MLPVIRRAHHQRHIAGILGVAMLAYALLVPIAEAKLIGMSGSETQATADEAPCHSAANDGLSTTRKSQNSPCCQVGRCFCVMLSATVALPGTIPSRLIPVHDPVPSFVSSLHSLTLIELPLRPPDA